MKVSEERKDVVSGRCYASMMNYLSSHAFFTPTRIIETLLYVLLQTRAFHNRKEFAADDFIKKIARLICLFKAFILMQNEVSYYKKYFAYISN